ncbi:c6 zinc finger domain containing [Fusarium albosuccineum]|uniref:C6 zinc finger domain containing n=1 Tax=Fusarium albosuccineum TaxID=1237068 RepID=A0A8H4PKP6_9HYPO|nr:c6 zinc finger domain containing [Fusarium albosuccineum]
MQSLQPPPSANTPLNLSFSPSAQAVDFDMLLSDIESLEYSQSYYYSGTDSREAAGNEVPAVSPNILNPESETEHFVTTPISLSHIIGCDDDSWACSLNTTVAPHVQSDGHGPFSFHWHPIVGDNSPESIALIFDNRVCEVLCIKESSTGNPWRKIVWPLARKHDALYHAVAAMTCFHGSNRLPQLRGEGMRHLESGMKKLSAEGHSEMPLEVALAVTLALSIAKTWYHPRASNGIDYINNAKDLLQEAVSRNLASKPLEGDLSLVFLANTWLYMDVLTRITCQNIQVADFSPLSACVPKGHGADSSHQVDPLMGCAETLFPLIGRVADLVRRVRLTRSRLNSPAVVSLAVELKMSIASWVPSVNSEVSFDEGDALTSDASDLVQTANAYKWATLLLLYQAVPELPGHLSFSELAQKVLVLIATVPLNSRATIFPIFPLMVAGCETTEAEDRDWVRHRWQSVADGNSSGIVERCLELTLEVWRRRDALKRPPLPLASALVTRDGGLGMGDGCGESTVKSKSHWLSVMEEWGWEGKIAGA